MPSPALAPHLAPWQLSLMSSSILCGRSSDTGGKVYSTVAPCSPARLCHAQGKQAGKQARVSALHQP